MSRVPVESHEHVETPLVRLLTAAQRLRELDPGRLNRVLALAKAYVSLYDSPDQTPAEIQARVDAIQGRIVPKVVN
jgi:hypothetical protein